MRTRVVALVVLALGVSTVALAWPFKSNPFKKKAAEEDPVEIVEEKRPPKPTHGALFTDPLPIPAGPVPKGLANLSAQGCNACHYDAHDDWARSGHATGHRSEAMVAAVAEAGTPACNACHRPLVEQSPDRVAYDGGDPGKPVVQPNPTYDPTLAAEGVTCAACHVRKGNVVAGRPPGAAPHPTVWSAQLGTSEACAVCHQLTWPGATAPLYDTYGEWKQSAHAKAGLQCQDCHVRSGVGDGVASHAFATDPSRAVSLLVRIDRVDLVRGTPEPATVAIRLQNTGAGHAFPTGSPFRGVRLSAVLEGPADDEGNPATAGQPLQVDLARTVSTEPPWAITEDTRLAPGGERSWEWAIALPAEAAAGDWQVRVGLVETVRGEPVGPPFAERVIPLRVD